MAKSNTNTENSAWEKDCDDKMKLRCTGLGTDVMDSVRLQLRGNMVKANLTMLLKDEKLPKCKKSKTNKVSSDQHMLLNDEKLPR